MTFEHQNGFGRQPLRNTSPTFEPHYGDPKKMGIFGAPACRCTTLVLALCLALSGLVVCGVGGVIAGFMWPDQTPRGLGLALVALGILMMFGGFGLYLWDSYYNTPSGAQYREPGGAQIRHVQVVNTIQAPNVATISGATTQLNRQAPSQESSPRGPEAPPPYDDIMNTSIEYRQKPVGAASAAPVVRPSYQSAVVGARVTSTTTV